MNWGKEHIKTLESEIEYLTNHLKASTNAIDRVNRQISRIHQLKEELKEKNELLLPIYGLKEELKEKNETIDLLRESNVTIRKERDKYKTSLNDIREWFYEEYDEYDRLNNSELVKPFKILDSILEPKNAEPYTYIWYPSWQPYYYHQNNWYWVWDFYNQQWIQKWEW